jgi:hypothetical protein
MKIYFPQKIPENASLSHLLLKTCLPPASPIVGQSTVSTRWKGLIDLSQPLGLVVVVRSTAQSPGHNPDTMNSIRSVNITPFLAAKNAAGNIRLRLGIGYGSFTTHERNALILSVTATSCSISCHFLVFQWDMYPVRWRISRIKEIGYRFFAVKAFISPRPTRTSYIIPATYGYGGGGYLGLAILWLRPVMVLDSFLQLVCGSDDRLPLTFQGPRVSGVCAVSLLL